MTRTALQERSSLFSVEKDNPFIIFQKLQDIARASLGDSQVIDLSRGDPGYGFTPSVHGREFGSYVLWLDGVLNRDPEHRFPLYTEKDLQMIQEKIKKETKKAYQPDVAARLLDLLQTFTEESLHAAQEEGKNWNEFNVLWELFSYCAMSGGSYLHPRGQVLTRVLVAAWHRKEYGVQVTSEDLLLTGGVSHGVGTLFKALGEEGCGFLQRGDTVCTASPVYSPYNSMIEERGLSSLSFSIDPLTGKISAEDIRALREASSAPKVLFLIDPNNPTGFSLSQEAIRELATIAEERNMLVITDEVYYSFFPRKETMLKLCPKRTICMNTRSKLERSTGLRFGEIIILPEGRTAIAKMLGLTDGAAALEQLLLFCKAPGRTGGQFQHTTFVPGPSQLLGIAHIVLGKSERETYLLGLQENRDLFCQELSLPHKGNNYYIIFDLDALPGCVTQSIPIEKRLLSLAEAGVVYIPAYRFFSEKDRGKTGILTSVRASVVNTTAERLVEATRRTKEVLC